MLAHMHTMIPPRGSRCSTTPYILKERTVCGSPEIQAKLRPRDYVLEYRSSFTVLYTGVVNKCVLSALCVLSPVTILQTGGFMQHREPMGKRSMCFTIVMFKDIYSTIDGLCLNKFMAMADIGVISHNLGCA